jgi:hypothetical protein
MTSLEWAGCRCGRRFQRPRGSEETICLACQTDERLTAAGICWHGPGLAAVRAWNDAVFADAHQAGES